MIIEIKPLDTLFFRDGKPFSMGDETWAEGMFPPAPSVIYGALRSAYFSQNQEEFSKANTPEDPTRYLEIKGLYYLIGGNLYYPVPSDLVQIKNRNKTEKNREKYEKTYKTVPLEQVKNSLSSLSECSTILTYKKEVMGLSQGIIDRPTFETYLRGFTTDLSARKLSDFIRQEPKIGIGRENSLHSSEQGKLYRVGMNRFKNLKFIVEFNGFDIGEKGFLKLGGEGKAASYKQKIDINTEVENPELNGNTFKLYFATPAIFKNGWLPDWIDKNTLIGNYHDLKLRLVTAVIGKPQCIGGFDMKNKKPKPMKKVVPAGSVYYFELIHGSMDQIINIFHKRTISDYSNSEGFGICYVGEII